MVEKEVVFENNLVKWFSKVGKKDVLLVGEKGANLGEVKALKLPVPDGFVVTTEAYDSFLSEAGLKSKIDERLAQIDYTNEDQLESAVLDIKEWILSADFSDELREEILDSYEYLGADKYEIEKGSALDILNNAAEPIFVAVRSSLPFSSSRTEGLREQDTYLNVKGNDELLSHIKKCFASLFNKSTIKRYFENNGKLEKLKIAVVVQKMVGGDKSGVAYSRDSSGNIVVKGIFGLGEGMNLKDVHSDKYVVSRDLRLLDEKTHEKNKAVVRDAGGNLKIVPLDKEISRRSSLSHSEVLRIGDLALKVEEHFKNPQEIEFAIGEDIHLLQTKNLLDIPQEKEEIKVEERKEEDILDKSVKDVEEVPSESAVVKSEVERVDILPKTKIKLLVDSPSLYEDYKATGLRKVGIFRVERTIFNAGKHPNFYLKNNYINEYENLIYRDLKRFVDGFGEVWVHLSDFLTSDFKDLEGAPEVETNPMMGLHGVRYLLKNPDLLEAEIRAVKRADGRRLKTGILIPNVVSMDEVQKVRDLLLDLNFDVKVGVVLSTPASVQLIKDFVESGVENIVIDLEGLIQYLLAVDKENPSVVEFLDEAHPSLLYQLQYVIRVCRRRNVPTSAFGKSLKNEGLLKYLIKSDVSNFCVGPEEAKKFSERVAEIEKEVLEGTDKEPRRYDLNKERAEYLEETPKTMEDLKVLEETEKLKMPVTEEIIEGVEAIKKEKQEYLDGKKELVEGEEGEVLKEHEKEKFDEALEEIEDSEEIDEVGEEDDVEEEKEGEEDELYDPDFEEDTEEKGDALGIF